MSLQDRLLTLVQAIGADVKSIKAAMSSGGAGAAPVQDTGWRKIYGDQGYWEIQFRRIGNSVEVISSSYEVPLTYARNGLLLSSVPGFKPNQSIGDVQYWGWYFPNDTPIRMVLKANGTVAYAGPATGISMAPEIPSMSGTSRYIFTTSDDWPTVLPGVAGEPSSVALAPKGDKGDKGDPGTSAAVALGVYLPSAYGTVDGTNDEVQINAAINAANAAGGGEVVLDKAEYVCHAPVVPKAGVTIRGHHTPAYSVSVNPASASKLRVGSGFVGSGLILPGNDAKGCAFISVALVGNAQLNSTGNVIHGMRMPDVANMNGEQGWTIKDVTIAGFTGSGIFGTVWVWSVMSLFINSCSRYGIECAAGTGDKWNDSKVVNIWVFFNKLGGLFYGGGMSAANNFENGRFERSGQVFGNPENNPTSPAWVNNAPGVALYKAQLNNFANCITDANTGPGWDIYGEAADVNNNNFVACGAMRDAGGDQTTVLESGGFRIGGPSANNGGQQNEFKGCYVVPGKSKDGGASASKPASPKWGVHSVNPLQMGWEGRVPNGTSGPFLMAGAAYGTGFFIRQLNGDLVYIKDHGTPLVLSDALDKSSAQVVTGAKGFAPGTLLMRNSDGSRQVEPYSDVNAPQDLERTMLATAPVAPASGRSAEWTPDGKSLWMKAADGTVTVLGPNMYGAASLAAVTGYAADTYLAGSAIALPAGRVKAGTIYRLRLKVTKTAAGVATPVITVRCGTAGTTADAARTVLTFAAQTAVVDSGLIEVYCTFRAVGASAVLQSVGTLGHVLAATGLSTANMSIADTTSAAFDATGANMIMGVSVNGGTSAAWTISLVQAELFNLV